MTETKKRAKKEEVAPRKRGRPRAEIDPELLSRLAGIQCTMPEMASCLGVSLSTLEQRAHDDPVIRGIIEKERDEARASVRRKQYELAMAGDRTMLVWLGKNWLGQKDRTETDIHAEVEGPFILQFDKRYEKA